MAPSKSSLLFSSLSPRGSSPLLPTHEKRRSSDEYSLRELSPETEEAVLARSHLRKNNMSTRSESPSDPWEEPLSSAGSMSKFKQPSRFFKGPPPPIASSILVPRKSQSPLPGSRGRNTTSSFATGSRLGPGAFGSVMSENGSRHSRSRGPDSVWRGLERREGAISRDLQNLLDMQANGLVAGTGPTPSSTGSDLDALSDDGSSTPTATFYSTVTSRSRMLASLDEPPRANARGDVIPVRQPKASKRRGLRAAREGLREAMTALANLKLEEDAHIEAALVERKKAVSYLKRVDMRREDLSAKLEVLSDEGEEPLAKELRNLGSQHETLDKEIRELEERLVGMRNRKRWLERKMDDVKNRREAGLSGYRGALKEVEGELALLMKRPPIEPLDADILKPTEDGEVRTTGMDFLQMIPARRTVDMATDWWQGEMEVLEARKQQVNKEREALQSGLEMWQECVSLVSGFEAIMRAALEEAMNPQGKGKDDGLSPHDRMMSQLMRMQEITNHLKASLQKAEENNWNLLVCAIGAELEAFDTAKGLLEIDPDADSAQEPQRYDGLRSAKEWPDPAAPGSQASESDNEVPADLLVSHEAAVEEAEDPRVEAKSLVDAKNPRTEVGKRRVSQGRGDSHESDSDVPPAEFLAEHDPDSPEASHR